MFESAPPYYTFNIPFKNIYADYRKVKEELAVVNTLLESSIIKKRMDCNNALETIVQQFEQFKEVFWDIRNNQKVYPYQAIIKLIKKETTSLDEIHKEVMGEITMLGLCNLSTQYSVFIIPVS